MLQGESRITRVKQSISICITVAKFNMSGFGRRTCQRPWVRWLLTEDYRCSSTGLCQGRVIQIGLKTSNLACYSTIQNPCKLHPVEACSFRGARNLKLKELKTYWGVKTISMHKKTYKKIVDYRLKCNSFFFFLRMNIETYMK